MGQKRKPQQNWQVLRTRFFLPICFFPGGSRYILTHNDISGLAHPQNKYRAVRIKPHLFWDQLPAPACAVKMFQLMFWEVYLSRISLRNQRKPFKGLLLFIRPLKKLTPCANERVGPSFWWLKNKKRPLAERPFCSAQGTKVTLFQSSGSTSNAEGSSQTCNLRGSAFPVEKESHLEKLLISTFRLCLGLFFRSFGSWGEIQYTLKVFPNNRIDGFSWNRSPRRWQPTGSQATHCQS